MPAREGSVGVSPPTSRTRPCPPGVMIGGRGMLRTSGAHLGEGVLWFDLHIKSSWRARETREREASQQQAYITTHGRAGRGPPRAGAEEPQKRWMERTHGGRQGKNLVKKWKTPSFQPG